MLITFVIGVAAFLATLGGGFFALYYRDKLHIILGFSAGAVIGVAFFDLLPESIGLAGNAISIETMTAIVALGFVVYMILDRIILFHSHVENEQCENSHHHHRDVQPQGILGAVSLSVHSFLDGLAIGLAFQVSAAVGAIVAAAVLVHDFSDGINTVGLVIKNSGTRKGALQWLLLDAIAPLFGVAVSLLIHIPATSFAIILALFCGFFLYIGASDLLPESRHGHPVRLTTVMTIIGISLMYIVIRIVG